MADNNHHLIREAFSPIESQGANSENYQGQVTPLGVTFSQFDKQNTELKPELNEHLNTSDQNKVEKASEREIMSIYIQDNNELNNLRQEQDMQLQM